MAGRQARETIVIDDSSSDGSGAPPPPRRAAPPAAPPAAAAAHAEFEDDEAAEAEAAEEEQLEYLGQFKTQIVGIRYYEGKVGRNEMVKLVREADNPYDANAVRVENIRSEKVGHLRRELVAEIAPLLDRGLVAIEGIMPGTGKSTYTMPLQVFCFGPSSDVLTQLQRRVQRAGSYLTPADEGDLVDSSGAFGHRGGGGGGVPNVTARVLAPAQMEGALDKLFEDLLRRGGVPLHADPSDEITSELYPHQTAALAWMVCRENEGGLPPFWERQAGARGGGPQYVNTLTNTPTPERPRPVRGGILADDMGLGKTLVVLALIATNRPGAAHPAFYTRDAAADAEAGGGGGGEGAAKAGGGKGGKGGKGAAGGGEEGGGAGPSGSGAAEVARGGGGAAARKAGGRAAKAKRRRGGGGEGEEEAEWAPGEEEEGGEEEAEDDEEEEEEWRAAKKRKARGKAKKPGAAEREIKARAQANAAAKKAMGKAPAAAAAAAAGIGSPTKPLAPAARRDPDAPPPAPPAAGGPRGTLLVAPLSVLSNWATQIEEHTAGGLELHIYHGPDRNRSPAFLASRDIVITTYSVLAGELASPRSGLLAVQWARVVLDEGHSIKNPDTRQAQARFWALLGVAAMKLKAERRWVVTGTPLQNRNRNRVGDLFSIMCFLGVEPLNDRPFWRRLLERPLKGHDERGLMRLQARPLRAGDGILMGALALRRTKATPGLGGRPMVRLPSKTTVVLEVDLGREDAADYAALEAESRELVGRHLGGSGGGGGGALSEYTNILAIIMRLRQVCDSRTLCPHALELLRASAARGGGGGAPGAPPPPELLAKLLAALTGGDDDGGAEECSICLNPFSCPVITRCAHVFCRRCIEASITLAKAACPLCRSPLTKRDLIDPPPPEQADPTAAAAAVASSGGGGAAGSAEGACRGSSKALLLLQKLRALQARAPGRKAVVFSQFLGMMDVVAAALDAASIPYVRLDGRATAVQRADMLRAFGEAAPGAPRVFLASLKAGGVGMNLTAASECHILEPHWNPAVEDQAADRVHRLGQPHDVQVYRYIARGTIEERMLELQERKRALASAAFDVRAGASAREARLNDLRLLMRL
ncbi:MAG: SNF2 family N-terminal domain-containing protein [Monoraphidium minutum]|nr:MAG: SNF2 family N-terminal domain-containing protein [Monoraphidium minutum]